MLKIYIHLIDTNSVYINFHKNKTKPISKPINLKNKPLYAWYFLSNLMLAWPINKNITSCMHTLGMLMHGTLPHWWQKEEPNFRPLKFPKRKIYPRDFHFIHILCMNIWAFSTRPAAQPFRTELWRKVSLGSFDVNDFLLRFCFRWECVCETRDSTVYATGYWI